MIARILCAVLVPCLVVLGGCSGDREPGADGVVPWTDEPAGAAQLAQVTTAPTCRISELELPSRQQQWGGVWNDAVAGYFVIENAGRRPCTLPRPSRVTATTETGARTGFEVGSIPATSPVLDPGGQVQVQVGSPYDCGRPLARSTGFALTFPTGRLQVPGARMAVQCGGTLADFSARSLGTSYSGGSLSGGPTSRLRASMSRVPESVPPGEPVRYVVTLTNPTSAVVLLDRCPSYQEGLKGQPSSVRTYRLNCEDVTRIGAHDSVRFAMELPTSDEVRRGAAVIDWKLVGLPGAVDEGHFASATTRIE